MSSGDDMSTGGRRLAGDVISSGVRGIHVLGDPCAVASH